MVDRVRLADAKSVFNSVLERPLGQRSAFIDSACGENIALRRKVDRMLDAHQNADGWMEPSSHCIDCEAILSLDDEAAPTPERIGRYRIKRRIASGGMGTIYEGVQDSPRRTVAVKIMRRGLLHRSAARRFEYESQILGRLRHPCIAQVYEAGVHREGDVALPYFVMEYVPNARSLTGHVVERSLNTRDRLVLFVQVCRAVHHGHQRGIIHRDLKPENILVDSSGQPKVIDFGVARATDSDLAVTTMQTNVGQLVGTVQYMSPEQVDADPNDIDTRSDVYSLGVILYELLTGALPYVVSGRPLHEATRIVKEDRPSKLTMIDTSCRGDIQTIVSKALDKDREHRYGSASELADDILRFLSGEAIHARPPTVTYQLCVFVRRNRVLVSGVALLLLALTGGVVGTTMGMLGAQRERDDVQSLTNVLTSAIGRADPWVAQGRDVTVREVLDDLAARFEPGASVALRPIRRAEIQTTIGIAYRHLGHFEDGEWHLRAAYEIRRDVLGDPHEETLTTMYELGLCLQRSDKLNEAEACYESILDLYEAGAIPECHSVAASLRGIGETSQVVEEKEAYVYRALNMFRELFGEENLDVAWCLNNIAWIEKREGNSEKAIDHFEQSLVMLRRTVGPNHPQVAYSLDGLGNILKDLRRFEEAEPYLRETYELRRKVLGDEHPYTRQALHYYAMLVLNRLRNYGATEPLFRESLALSRRHGTYQTLGVRFALFGLGWSLYGQDRVEEAEPLLREAVEMLDAAEEGVGEGIILAQALESVYGGVLSALGRYEEAEEFLIRAYTRVERDRHDYAYEEDLLRQPAEAAARLVELYEAWGKPDQAAHWRETQLQFE